MVKVVEKRWKVSRIKKKGEDITTVLAESAEAAIKKVIEDGTVAAAEAWRLAARPA
jgi:hypothetical protein